MEAAQITVTAERLEAKARGAGLEELDFDEAVTDLFDHGAAALYNSGALPELGDEDAHEQLHDQAGHDASLINNAGLEAQLRCLIVGIGIEATERLVDELVDER